MCCTATDRRWGHIREILQLTTQPSKSLTSTECRYSNIEREALGILHDLEKFHHYCFARDITVITDHKPMVAIFKTDVVMLSQRIQCIILRIHQYRMSIIYKPGPKNFIADWLSWHSHEENKEEAINGLDLRVDAVQVATDVPECMSIQ